MCDKLCSGCKHFEYDEYWYPDDEEEYGVFNCKKGNLEHIGWNQPPCEKFEE